MSEVCKLLERWIRMRLGDDVNDTGARLEAYRKLIPGRLPGDYAEGLLFIRTLVSLHPNEIVSVEPSLPPIPGQFVFIGPNPPVDLLYGLQHSHSNVFDGLSDSGDIFPRNLVGIGGDRSGNEILLDVSEAGNGRIYHWWVTGDRTPDEDGNPGWGNIFLLAHSFTDLLRRMRPAPEDDEEGPPVGRVCYVR